MASNSTNGTNGAAHGEGSLPHIPLQINGQDVETSVKIDVVSPATGKVVWTASSASKADAINAVEAAQAAFPAWSKTKPATRRDIFLKAGEILAKRANELIEYMGTEMAAPPPFSEFNTTTTAEMLKDIAGRIVTISASLPVCGQEGMNAIVYREPYGVILGFAPWNAPYILGARAVAYAIAAGNTTVLKGSELSPRCFWAIGAAFKEAGLPDGVLNIIASRPQDAAEVTTAMIEHPAVKKVNFTGSTAVGRIIATTAGKNLKPCLMELGGKASAIVLADANLEKAATGCALGAFLNAGQVCMATERILVHNSILPEFTPALRTAITNIFGDSTPAPVLISGAAVRKNRTLVSSAVSSGAKIVYGDPNAQESSETRMRPIVMEGITKEMSLYADESFGPSVSLVGVDSEEEAIAIANDTEYGLAGAVFTENLAAGLRVAKQIESGAVHINHMTIHDEPNIPHGGLKASGWGRFNAQAGFDEFLRSKTVTWQD